MDGDDGTWDVIPREELTWLENASAWAGYVFCEVAFLSPNWVWSYLFFPAYCHSLGVWFCDKAFGRWRRTRLSEGWRD